MLTPPCSSSRDYNLISQSKRSPTSNISNRAGAQCPTRTSGEEFRFLIKFGRIDRRSEGGRNSAECRRLLRDSDILSRKYNMLLPSRLNRGELKGLQFLLSYSQAGTVRKAKQGQDEISHNHVPTFFLGSVQRSEKRLVNLVKKDPGSVRQNR